MFRTFMLGALLALLTAPAFAQDSPYPILKVGEDAAEFTPRNVINTPWYTSFAELKGDVILIKAWGKN